MADQSKRSQKPGLWLGMLILILILLYLFLGKKNKEPTLEEQSTTTPEPRASLSPSEGNQAIDHDTANGTGNGTGNGKNQDNNQGKIENKEEQLSVEKKSAGELETVEASRKTAKLQSGKLNPRERVTVDDDAPIRKSKQQTQFFEQSQGDQ
jgi:hypothetical protein